MKIDLVKIRNCLPLMTPDAGLDETLEAFDALIAIARAAKRLVMADEQGSWSGLDDYMDELRAELYRITDSGDDELAARQAAGEGDDAA